MSIIPDAVDPVPSSDRALIVASTILDSNHDDVVEADSTKKSNMDSNQDSGHCSPELGELPGNDVVSPTNDTCKPIESTTTARLHVDFDQEEPDKSNSSSRATIDTSSVFNAIDSNTANHVVCQSNPIAPVNVDFISSPHLVSTSPASSTSTVVKNELPVSTGTDSMSVKSDSPVQPPQSSFDKVNESTLLKSASTSSNNNAAQLSSSQAVSENIVITEITKDLPTIEFESMCIASTSGTLNVLRKPASPSSSSSLSNDFIEQSTATSPLREGYNHESVKESEDESTIQRESNAFGASSDDDDDPIENANSDDNCDIIDGIMFLNFETEKELNDFSRKQDKDSNKSSTLLAKSFGPLESRCQLTIRRRRGRGSGVSRRNQIRVLSKSVQSLGADSDANSCESPAPLPSLTRCAASTGRKPRGRKKSRLNQSELDHSNRSIITMPEPTPALLDNSFKNADLDRFLQNTFNTYDLKPEVSVNRSAMFTISSAKRETRNQKKIIESINRSYDGGFGCDEMPKLTLYDAPRDECEPVAHLPQLPNSPSVSPAPRSENPATEVRKRGRPKKNVDLTMTTPEKETISLSPKAVVKIVASTPLVSKEKKNQPPPAGSSKKRQVLSLVNRTIDPLNSIGIANPDDLFRRLVTTRQLDRRHIEENEKYVLLSMEDSYPRFALSTLDGNVVPTNTSISLEQDRPIKSEPVDSVSISTTVLLDTPTTAGLTETNLIDEAPIDSIKREPVDQSTQKATTVVKRRKSEGYIAKSLDLTSSSVLKHSKRDIRLPARYDSSNLVLGSTWEIPELNNNPVRERDPLIKRKKSMKRVKQSLANQCQDELPTLDDVAGIMCEPDEPTSLEIIKGNNIVSIKPNDCFARTVTPDLDTLKSSYKDYTRNKKDVTTNENDEFKGREPISVLSASATNRGDIVATLSSTVAGDISQAESTDTSCNVERQTKIERLKELYRALYYSNDPIRKRVCFEKMIKPRVNKKEVIEEAITTIQELQHKQQMIHKMQQLMKLWNKELQICLSNICESPVALNAHEQESIMKVITSYKKVILPTVDSLQHKMDQDKYQQNTALEQTVSTLVEQQMLVKRQSSLSVVASNRMAKVPNYDGSKLVKKSSHKLKPFRKSRSDAESSKSISLLAKPPIPHHHPIVTESSGVSPTKKRMVASSAFNWASKVEAPINSASVTITPLPTNSSTAFNETVDLIPQMESGSDFSVVSSVQPVPDLTGQIPSSPVVRSIPRSTEQQQREAIFLLKKKKELDDLLLMQQKHRAEISLRWKQRCAEKRQKIISYKPKSNSYSAISNQASNSAQQSSQQHSVATKPINLNPSVGTIALNGFGVKNQFQNLNSLLPATKNSGVITLKLTNNNLQTTSVPYIPLQTVAAVTPVAQPTYNSMLNNSHGTTTAFFATPSSNALQSNVVQAISSSNGNCNKVCIDSTISAHMKQFARILPKGSDIHNLKINSVSYMQPSIQLIPGSNLIVPLNGIGNNSALATTHLQSAHHLNSSFADSSFVKLTPQMLTGASTSSLTSTTTSSSTSSSLSSSNPTSIQSASCKNQ